MFNKEKKAKRFTIKEEQGLAFDAVYVVVDNVTGVNYLMTASGGLTPLLDSDGKVLIDPLHI